MPTDDRNNEGRETLSVECRRYPGGGISEWVLLVGDRQVTAIDGPYPYDVAVATRRLLAKAASDV